jgi:hypothetical protein
MIPDEHVLAKLARERAMNIHNRDELKLIFGLDDATFDEIEANDLYKRILQHSIIEWNSPLSTPERIKIISAAYVEETLPIIGSSIMAEKTPLSEKVEAAKYLAKNAGIGEGQQQQAGAGADRFVITINLGADTEVYSKSIEVKANDDPPVKLPVLPEPR